MRALDQSVEAKRELSLKPTLSIYWSLYPLTVTYGHDQNNKVAYKRGHN